MRARWPNRVILGFNLGESRGNIDKKAKTHVEGHTVPIAAHLTATDDSLTQLKSSPKRTKSSRENAAGKSLEQLGWGATLKDLGSQLNNFDRVVVDGSVTLMEGTIPMVVEKNSRA